MPGPKPEGFWGLKRITVASLFAAAMLRPNRRDGFLLTVAVQRLKIKVNMVTNNIKTKTRLAAGRSEKGQQSQLLIY